MFLPLVHRAVTVFNFHVGLPTSRQWFGRDDYRLYLGLGIARLLIAKLVRTGPRVLTGGRPNRYGRPYKTVC